jgi:hypothetical protein
MPPIRLTYERQTPSDPFGGSAVVESFVASDGVEEESEDP